MDGTVDRVAGHVVGGSGAGRLLHPDFLGPHPSFLLASSVTLHERPHPCKL